MAGTALQDKQTSPEMMSGQANFEPNPQAAEGFFVEIEKVEPLREDTRNGHELSLGRFVMASGLAYEVELARPAETRSDTAIVSTTPWLTGRKGFNTQIARQFNGIGYPTISVTPKGGAISANLRTSAHNMNVIVDNVLSKTELRPDRVLGFGASRAGSVGLGLEKSAYTDLIAPCFPQACKPGDLPTTVAQLGFEAIELGKHIARLGLDIRHHHETFSRNPIDWLHYGRTIPHLLGGDTGRLAWASGSHTHITLLDKDGWSQPDIWNRLADDRPNLTISVIQGRHMTLANRAVLQHSIDRFDDLAEERGIDGDFDSIDYGKITAARQKTDSRPNVLGGLSVGNLIKAGLNFAAVR